MQKKPILILVIVCSLVHAGGAALGHKGASGVVKERMDTMKEMATAMKSMAPIIKGEASYDADIIREGAASIAVRAKNIAEQFPEGSDGHPSEASARIWGDWEEFEAGADALRKEAAALENAADEGADAVRVQFGKLAGSCKGCHQDFRVKQQ